MTDCSGHLLASRLRSDFQQNWFFLGVIPWWRVLFSFKIISTLYVGKWVKPNWPLTNMYINKSNTRYLFSCMCSARRGTVWPHLSMFSSVWRPFTGITKRFLEHFQFLQLLANEKKCWNGTVMATLGQQSWKKPRTLLALLWAWCVMKSLFLLLEKLPLLRGVGKKNDERIFWTLNLNGKKVDTFLFSYGSHNLIQFCSAL
jgi:hypothetical protein